MDLKEKQVVYHDWESSHYDEKWSISFDDRCIAYAVRVFRSVVPHTPSFGRTLEVGSGTGFFLLNLAQAGIVGEPVCTDISPGMVATCIENGRRLGMEVDGRVADAESLPFADESFDLVIGHAVVHHLPDVAQSFKEMLRVLRPGGRLVIAGEPTRVGDRIAGRVKQLTRIQVKLAAAILGADRVLEGGMAKLAPITDAAAVLEYDVDVHEFRPRDLEEIVRDAGFADVRTRTDELTASWFGWWTRTMEGMVGMRHLPSGYPLAAYRVWKALYALDERVAKHLVPDEAFYNCVVTGLRPEGPEPARRA